MRVTLTTILIAANLLPRPQNKEELFNLRHSSLRNVIERIFGILKRSFRIIRTAPEYRFEDQVLLVLALCGLHNYIREHAAADEEELGLEAESEVEEVAGNYYDTPLRPPLLRLWTENGKRLRSKYGAITNYIQLAIRLCYYIAIAHSISAIMKLFLAVSSKQLNRCALASYFSTFIAFAIHFISCSL